MRCHKSTAPSGSDTCKGLASFFETVELHTDEFEVLQTTSGDPGRGVDDETLGLAGQASLGSDLEDGNQVPAAVAVVCSTFERNMYRYREPRTFRTVFMDAGHLAGTLAILAHSAGVQPAIYLNADQEEIERAQLQLPADT